MDGTLPAVEWAEEQDAAITTLRLDRAAADDQLIKRHQDVSKQPQGKRPLGRLTPEHIGRA
jgi:hypothetical protein